MSQTKNKVFYGWYVVAAGCAIMAMTMGIIMNCFGQFIKPVCTDMGFTRQQMSMNQTLMAVVSMVMATMWGKLYKKINLHRWMSVAAVLTPVFYFCYSFARNIYEFYAVTILMSVAYCIISMLVFTYIIGNWFHKNRGVAIGLASMGSGIGAMVMNTVISQMILSYGWRSTYRILAVMIFVVVVPAIIFIVRERPSDKGLLPYGHEEEPEDKEGSEAAPAFEGFTFAQARKMPVFWGVVISSIGLVMAICMFYQTLSPHLSDNGYSVTFAAVMTSVSMGALAVGKVALGRLFDKLGTRKAAFIACICTLIGLIGMIFCQYNLALVAIIVGVGLGCSFGAICMPIITQNIFGMKDYNSIYGMLSAATGLGSAIAPIISGRTYDVYKSYDPVYIAAALITLAGIIILMLALPKKDNA
ncbi:MAG: MFS transporter [Clostridiaceae bacterium]|nr:MFS transporter [Clostridiaceae bacterium]